MYKWMCCAQSKHKHGAFRGAQHVVAVRTICIIIVFQVLAQGLQFPNLPANVWHLGNFWLRWLSYQLIDPIRWPPRHPQLYRPIWICTPFWVFIYDIRKDINPLIKKTIRSLGVFIIILAVKFQSRHSTRMESFIMLFFELISLNIMLRVSFSPGRDRAWRQCWISSFWTPSGKRRSFCFFAGNPF